MSQNTKSLKGARLQERKRKINVVAEQKKAEPQRKRGRPTKLKSITTPSPAGRSKKLKTIQKTPQAFKEHTPVTPTETPPSAEVVPITTSNRNSKKQLQTPRRSNPPREVRTAARALQLQKTVAPIPLEKPHTKGKIQRKRPQKKRNRQTLRKIREQLFQPEAEADVVVADYGIVPTESQNGATNVNNNNGYLLAEEVELQYFYV